MPVRDAWDEETEGKKDDSQTLHGKKSEHHLVEVVKNDDRRLIVGV